MIVWTVNAVNAAWIGQSYQVMPDGAYLGLDGVITYGLYV